MKLKCLNCGKELKKEGVGRTPYFCKVGCRMSLRLKQKNKVMDRLIKEHHKMFLELKKQGFYLKGYLNCNKSRVKLLQELRGEEVKSKWQPSKGYKNPNYHKERYQKSKSD